MEKRKKKRVLIIVHGSWRHKVGIGFVDNMVSNVLDFVTSKRSIKRRDYHQFADFMDSDYDEIEFFRWNGGLIEHDKEILRLQKYLERFRNGDIDIVAGSLGGYIVRSALLKSNVKINKLLFIGAVHEAHHKFKNVKKVINVYSKIDKMFFWANDIYEGIGNAFLKGTNVSNIALENIRHDNLFLNKPIKHKQFKDKFLYDLYRSLLVKK